MNITHHEQRTEQEAPTMNLSSPFERLERELPLLVEELLRQSPDSILDAAVRQMLAKDLRYLAERRKAWRGIVEQRIVLEDVGDVREVSFAMFSSLAAQAVWGTGAVNNRSYRSVSVCSSSRYFRRPLISTIGRAFEQAVAPNVQVQQQSATQPILLDRILIVPDRYWAKPDPPSTCRHEILRFWKPILEDVAAQQARCQQNGLIEFRLRVVSQGAARACQLQVRELDFGLYGNIAVGMYQRKGVTEVLLLCGRHSNELRAAEAAWRELSSSQAHGQTWDEFITELDVDPIVES